VPHHFRAPDAPVPQQQDLAGVAGFPRQYGVHLGKGAHFIKVAQGVLHTPRSNTQDGVLHTLCSNRGWGPAHVAQQHRMG